VWCGVCVWWADGRADLSLGSRRSHAAPSMQVQNAGQPQPHANFIGAVYS
jgi:hypothetical protein